MVATAAATTSATAAATGSNTPTSLPEGGRVRMTKPGVVKRTKFVLERWPHATESEPREPRQGSRDLKKCKELSRKAQKN